MEKTSATRELETTEKKYKRIGRCRTCEKQELNDKQLSRKGDHILQIGKNEVVISISFMKLSFSSKGKRRKKRIVWACLTNWRTNNKDLKIFLRKIVSH